MTRQVKGVVEKIDERVSKTTGKKYWVVELLCAGAGEGEANKVAVMKEELMNQVEVGSTVISTMGDDNNIASKMEVEVEDDEVPEDVLDVTESGVPTGASHVPKKQETKKEPASDHIDRKTNRNKMDIAKEFIISIQGKDFITANGLLAIAQNEGGINKIEILELVIDYEKVRAHSRVKVTMKDGREFENVGSANSDNLKPMMKKNFIEMSITRALSRAIRFGLGVDYCSAEELSEDK